MADCLPVPPVDLRLWVGPFADAGLFRESGEEMLRALVDLCGITSDEHVLEVGCGCGRLALALAERLGPPGRYEGFDVAQPLVGWCRVDLEPVLPNFRFRFVDVLAPACPEEGMVCEENWMFGLIDRRGLETGHVRRGDWRDVRSYAISQDIIVARKS
jgi:SAM-dependent methyltransferase